MCPVKKRALVVVLGLLGALVVGGVSQTLMWRWGLDVLSVVTGSQFTWVLLIFGISWAWAEGRLVAGLAAGATTGLALIASYYVVQWLVDGRHAAVSQFVDARGAAWLLATLAGGAFIGVFGALAGRDARGQPVHKAVGLTLPGLVAAAGPVVWLATNSEYLEPARLGIAAGVLVLVGIGLVAVAVRTCGVRAAARGLAVSAAIGAAALVGLLTLQTQGWLYLTF